MKKILLSTITLTLMSGFAFGMQRNFAPVATPAVPVAPAIQAPVVAALPAKQANVLADTTLIARLNSMKAIIEANESELDKKVTQLEAFADEFDKLKKSSVFMSPSEIAEINTKICDTIKDIDATIISAQEWSLLPDGPQVAKLKEIKRRIHGKAKDYTNTWEFDRTMRVYSHSFWKPTLTVGTIIASLALLQLKNK